MSNSGDKWCRHRTPFGDEYKTCKAGVNFHQFEPCDYKMHPCLGENMAARARCDKYDGYTAEELASKEAAQRARWERNGKIRAKIIEKCGEQRGSGTLECPCCEGGTVSYSRASNGHVHAKCSTAGCASWME